MARASKGDGPLNHWSLRGRSSFEARRSRASHLRMTDYVSRARRSA